MTNQNAFYADAGKVENLEMEHSFTVEIQKRSDSRIVIPLSVENPSTKKLVNLWGLIDTGANVCYIKKSVAEGRLGLTELRKDTVVSGYKTETEKSVYNVNLILPTQTYLNGFIAAEFDNRDDFDFIIGMNVLLLCDFAVSSDSGSKIFSMHFPTTNRPIDFRTL